MARRPNYGVEKRQKELKKQKKKEEKAEKKRLKREEASGNGPVAEADEDADMDDSGAVDRASDSDRTAHW